MPVEVHVTGRVQLGRFPEFLEAAERWRGFRAERRSAACRVLQGLSGEMNLVRLVFTYPDAAAYEEEEARDASDPEYGRVASACHSSRGRSSTRSTESSSRAPTRWADARLRQCSAQSPEDQERLRVPSRDRPVGQHPDAHLLRETRACPTEPR